MSISQNFPAIRPTLNLNFARSKTLDPRITFTRSSTATYIDSDGLVKSAGVNQARFDHDPATGESLGLLIEEQRTNLVTYSEDFSHSSWKKQNGFSITSNTAIAPDGTLTADTASRVNISMEYLYTNISHSGAFTISCWVRSVSGSSTFKMGTYNDVDGSIFSPSYTATEEWQRFSFNSSITNGSSGYYPCIPDVSGAQFYIWGAQVESGSFSTSYIPTSGSAVTRSLDTASISGNNFSQFFNPHEGTFIAECDRFGGGTIENSIAVVNSTSNVNYTNTLIFAELYDASGAIGRSFTSGGDYFQNLQADISLPLTSQRGLFNKFSFAYKENDFAVTANNDFAVDGAGAIPPPEFLTNLRMMGSWSNTKTLNGRLKYLKYYPERLTNEQLQNLTK